MHSEHQTRIELKFSSILVRRIEKKNSLRLNKRRLKSGSKKKNRLRVKSIGPWVKEKNQLPHLRGIGSWILKSTHAAGTRPHTIAHTAVVVIASYKSLTTRRRRERAVTRENSRSSCHATIVLRDVFDWPSIGSEQKKKTADDAEGLLYQWSGSSRGCSELCPYFWEVWSIVPFFSFD